MRTFFRGADLIYQIQALYDDTGTVIDPSTFTAITATFCKGSLTVAYTLADSEVEVDGSNINIIVQRADFESKNEGKWDLKLETQETDANFASNVRVRIGEIIGAFRLDEPCD
jgi:hypothetical protein